MANLVRNFIKGRMNKSVDERLVPNGEYIDAQNIRMGSTEDSEIGAIENTKGNTQLTTLVYPPTGTALSANATCLGAYSDGANESMYWFVHDPSFVDGGYAGVLDLIVSYNMRNDLLTYHVVSTSALNFDPQYLITGIDLVDDLLFFTDDINPPRRINVGQAYPQPVAFADSGLLYEDILVIKRPPLQAPLVTPVAVVSREDYMEDRFLCFGYRWEYANNEYSATSQFSAPIFESEPFAFTTESYLNEGMVNSVQVCDVTVRTGSSIVKGIDILFKEMDDNIIRVIEKVDKADSALADNSDYTIQFSKQKIFTILPESEILRLYDNVPRLAKAQTLMGNRIVYGNYLEGYDMRNLNGLNVKLGFNASLVRSPLDSPDGVSPVTPSAPSLHSNRVYEIGIVYMDEYGRSSTALVAPNNKVEIDCGQSIFQNQIRVTIPSLMLAPAWAARYKFVIKPDSENYETIYTNQNFEYPADSGEVYFLLEGENAAKVEEGDRYIVKSDTSGAVTSCTYATVLEKKSFAEGELDDTPGTPVPAISGTYMKMKPGFTYGLPSGVENITPGEQSAGTNGGDDQRTEGGAQVAGDYPYLVYTGFDLDDINTGTRIRLTISFTRQGRGDASCETRTLDFDHTWEVEDDYSNIMDWFYGSSGPSGIANDVIDTIEAAEGVSGDPAVAAPTNEVQAATASALPNFGIGGNGLVNKLFFNQTGLADPEFVIIGTNKCSGGFGSGSSPNRRSRIKAEWTITRSTDAIVFETEPQPALPDLWYESSASYVVDPFGNHYGNVQNQINSIGQSGITDTAFFNCISYGNGVESYKIRDSISGKPITLGNRVTTTSDERFSEVRRFADLTYSGVINDETNINKLNEFNLGLLNFKPLEDSYGPVEKLFGRRTDILTLQEDKISYVLAGKNLLTDSTGESVVTSVPQVLGTQVARVEDFGISNNPESFAEWGPHKFFTDSKRGSVIHLYGDGQNEQLEVISENGMRSWFRDTFISDFNTQKLGGYDPYMNEYVLASNEVFLPGQEDCIECNTIQTFTLTLAQQSFCVNLGNNVGPVPVNYAIIDPVADDDEFTITTTYDGTSVTTGPITSASQPPVPSVNKYSIIENTLSIDLDYTPGVTGRPFVVQIQVKCPDAADLSLRLITLNRTEDAAQSIHSEFQWVDGIFTSPLSSTAVKFLAGTNPVISNWQDFTVSQGANLGPTNGSTVIMAYNRIGTDNYTIRPTDRFRWLRSSTRYEQADIASLLADPAISDLVPAGADPEYKADFLMPSTSDEYLYLIWDYSTGAAPPPEEFLLDTYTGAAAGYSTRKLKTGVTVAARIRRSGDNIEADVEFDTNNEISLTSPISNASSGTYTDLADFVDHATTPRDAFVKEWKDQSGNGNHATQTSPTSQPKLYDATTGLITENGKPAANFDGTNSYFDVPSTQWTDGQMMASVVLTGTTLDDTYWVDSNNTTFRMFNGGSEHKFIAWPLTPIVISKGSSMASGQLLVTGRIGTTSQGYTLYENGSSVANTSTYTGTMPSTSLTAYIGQNNNNTQRYGGNMQELIHWSSNQTSNRTGIEENINSNYLIYQPTDQPTSGLLYDYGSATGGTDAAAAYSVRQLSDKAVIALRVRRDSDDEERNIGFDANGDLDTTAISDFCDTANGFVTRWWDQSVNGNHADQATDASQPQIYNGTAVITENGKPALARNSGGSGVLNTSAVSGATTISLFDVAVTGDIGNRVAQFGNVIHAGDFMYQGSILSFTSNSTTQALTSLFFKTTDEAYLNGSQVASGNAGTASAGSGVIGGQSATLRVIDSMQEVILWTADQSSNRTGIESNIDTYFQIP